MKGNSNSIKSESVKVAVRVRPLNKKEREEQSVICVEVNQENNSVSVSNPKADTRTFQFDYVYSIESTQREIYDQVAFPIVESIFQGYNGTIFAYGQTGCGKTFTMMGNAKDSELRGVIPNAFQHIFGFINAEASNKKFLLRCSFLEIYNEEVRDLLGNDPNKALEVREDKKKGTYVKDLSYTALKTPGEIIACLDKGNAGKHVGATSMNEHSSRSHSVFTVYLEIDDGDEKNAKIKSGKLNLVDLAGSERVGKTNATGQTLDEGKKINLSLTALGSVIDALSSNRKFIPYKDSKLTRLLSDALGGNTKTVMFANVSPASYNYEETLGTLRYASRAKLIKNQPKVNEDPKDALLRQYEEEIKLLKLQLDGKGTIGLELGNDEDARNINDGKRSNDDIVRPEELDSNEKQALLEKIAQLEHDMISKENNEIVVSVKKDDKEDNEFRQYRLQQLKNIDEIEKKLMMIQEEKRKEEEALQNDVSKLKGRIKFLKREIDDLKYDNEKDRIDFVENIKDVNRENALYKGIMKFMLSNNELRKIIEACRYNDETEQWKIHPFYFREKNLKLPTVKPYQVPDFIDNELSKRDMLMEDGLKHKREQQSEKSRTSLETIRKSNNNEKRLYDDYDNNNGSISNMNNGKYRINAELSRFNPANNGINPINNNDNSSINTSQALNYKKKKSIDKVAILSKQQQQQQPEHNGRVLESMSAGGMMSKKERERYEEAVLYNNKYNNTSRDNSLGISSNSTVNQSIGNSNQLLKPLKKGKMILDPIGRQNHLMNNKKYEVSFKATLELSDNNGNKIEFSPGINVNIGKRKMMLGKIPENSDADENNYPMSML